MVFKQNKDLLFGCHIVTIKIHFPDNSASKEDSTPQGFLPPTVLFCFVWGWQLPAFIIFIAQVMAMNREGKTGPHAMMGMWSPKLSFISPSYTAGQREQQRLLSLRHL
jgi:hypothetical protein